MRALLREAESRSRGLMDQVEESRARERRMSADAEDARRREMMEAGESSRVAFSWISGASLCDGFVLIC